MAKASPKLNAIEQTEVVTDLGVAVALSNAGDGTEQTWLWEVVTAPKNETAALTTPTTSTSS